MIVEYFGIPGSGKSFQANIYKQQLLKEGKTYIDISRWHGMPLWLKVFYKFIDYAVYALPRYRKQIKEYRKACGQHHPNSTYFSISQKEFIRDIVELGMIYDILQYYNGVVINDEGQLHRVVNLTINFKVPIESMLEVYIKYHHREHILYLGISVNDAFRRIKQRDRHMCEMDNMRDDDFLSLLETNQKICEEVIKLKNKYKMQIKTYHSN